MIITATGRTEICGNHTDHQHGKVLAAGINLFIKADIIKQDNDDEKTGLVHIISDGNEIPEIDIRDLELKEEEKGSSKALVRGVLAYLKNAGYKIGGFSAVMKSQVLQGSGLSSSAAFEVLVGRIISILFNESKIDDLTLAKAGQYAENVYFGKPCGLLDQGAISFGGVVAMDFADLEDVKVEVIVASNYDRVEEGEMHADKSSGEETDLKQESIFEKTWMESDSILNKMGLSLCIIDTGGSHAQLTQDYAAITEEMKSVSEYFGCSFLREVKEEDFYKALSEKSIYKCCSDRAILRAIHFFEEEKRVEAAAASLKNSDREGFLKTIKESGDSSYRFLQNVYSSRFPEEQAVSRCLALSEMLLKDKGVARVHGGGFAGTVQVFCDIDFVDEFKRNIEKYFGDDSCKVLEIV